LRYASSLMGHYAFAALAAAYADEPLSAERHCRRLQATPLSADAAAEPGFADELIGDISIACRFSSFSLLAGCHYARVFRLSF